VTIIGDLVTDRSPISAADELATFDRRFAEVRERLLRICTGLVGADHAEDVVHDVYLRTRARHQQLSHPDRFEAWVARSAVNLCYNRHRSQRRLREGLSRIAAGRPVAAARDPGLRELIEGLPPRERTVVVLRYGHGYSTDEIASLVGASAVNTRTILFRARRRLANQLREAER
jgi:RNA polymerase sigma-70 factor (ECF subfamily)